MDSPNRLSSLTVIPSMPRQTPRREFGDELAHALGQGAQFGAGVLGAVVPTPPVVSAAVSAVSRMVAPVAVSPGPSSTVQGAVTSLGTAGYQRPVESVPPGGAADTLSRQAELNRESQAFSAMYLQLQTEMQAESRQYNAVSNVIKVRHESARTAINNIR